LARLTPMRSGSSSVCFLVRFSPAAAPAPRGQCHACAGAPGGMPRRAALAAGPGQRGRARTVRALARARSGTTLAQHRAHTRAARGRSATRTCTRRRRRGGCRGGRGRDVAAAALLPCRSGRRARSLTAARLQPRACTLVGRGSLRTSARRAPQPLTTTPQRHTRKPATTSAAPAARSKLRGRSAPPARRQAPRPRPGRRRRRRRRRRRPPRARCPPAPAHQDSALGGARAERRALVVQGGAAGAPCCRPRPRLPGAASGQACAQRPGLCMAGREAGVPHLRSGGGRARALAAGAGRRRPLCGDRARARRARRRRMQAVQHSEQRARNALVAASGRRRRRRAPLIVGHSPQHAARPATGTARKGTQRPAQGCDGRAGLAEERDVAPPPQGARFPTLRSSNTSSQQTFQGNTLTPSLAADSAVTTVTKHAHTSIFAGPSPAGAHDPHGSAWRA